MAAGAGTIYRNYLLPLAGGIGQTAARQVDCRAALGRALGNEAGALWAMRNGYALATPEGLRRIDVALESSGASESAALRDLLEVGVQWDVPVTEPGATHVVTQVYCSALPVAYCNAPPAKWARLATLVLIHNDVFEDLRRCGQWATNALFNPCRSSKPC